MAFVNIPKRIITDMELKPAEKVLLCVLCMYADNSGRVVAPTQKIMARCSGLTEYWTRETLKELEKRGYIKLMADIARAREYQIMHWAEADECQ